MRIRELGFIHILKHGFQILSPVNWVSFPQFHIVAGVLGFTGLILAIRDGRTGCLRLLSTSEKRVSSEKSLFVPGLLNLGNNCFLNVVLQALASCACFHPFLQNLIEKDGFSADERVESMPLTVALLLLFAELCNPSDESLALSPRRVMLAMDYYIPNFNLTRQQDAAEAFLHLLSSLKEEVSEFYVPHYSSLADIFTFPQSKIPDPDRREGFKEQERWRPHFLGPFNGILGSTLTCKTCLSELSMDFEFFHSLPLSPLLDGETIIDGCSMEDCLKQFTAAEHIENYRCNRCWHAAAIKYLSTKGQEVQIEKLKSCVEEDSCECKSFFPREGLPWSNAVSRTFKQLRIARCPKILCIQLQRASVNGFGELIKLQGHISFPMVLDLFPFTTAAVGVGIEKLDGNVGRMRVNQHQNPVHRFNHFNMQFPTQMLQQIYGSTRNSMDITVETLVEEEAGNIINNEGDKHAQAFVPEPALDHSESCSCPKFTGSLLSDNKINNSCHLVPLRSCMYHLVSVVEHFGRVGSGHYTVYRRLRESNGAGSFGQFGRSQGRWFCVSDTNVSSASVKDVLAARASLVFYELEEWT